MLLLICHSALALYVAVCVCSCIKAARIPASSALLMVLLMPVPLGFTVMIRSDCGWYTPAPIDFFILNTAAIYDGLVFPIRNLEF